MFPARFKRVAPAPPLAVRSRALSFKLSLLRWQETGVFGPAASSLGAKTLHSKVQSKPHGPRFAAPRGVSGARKWPRALEICGRLQEFSRIPLAVRL